MKILGMFLKKGALELIMITFTGVMFGMVISDMRSDFMDEMKSSRELLETIITQQERLETIAERQEVLINYVLDMSEIQGKTTTDIVKMIRETAKKTVNIPLLERIEEDVMRANEQLPHKTDTIKATIGVRKKITN